jgi:hypothetical protein
VNQSITLLLGFVAGLLVVSFIAAVPILFTVKLVSGFSSANGRHGLRRDWLKYLGWGIASLLIVCFAADAITAPIVANHPPPLKYKAERQLKDMVNALILDQKVNGPLSSHLSEDEAMKELKNVCESDIGTSLASWLFDTKGRALDIWRTPVRVDLYNPKNPVVRSAGPDKIWGTADDLSVDSTTP